MADRVRAPCLLDASFRESARLRPTALSLDLETEDASTAQLTMPPQADALPMNDWIELFTLKGSAGYYRVSRDTEAMKKNRSYVLRHGIDTLHDSLWKEQRDFSGTVQEYLTALLLQQTAVYWQLGVCEDTGAWKKKGINYDHLDDLLNEVRAERQGYLFTYDFTTTPWTLSFVAAPGTVNAEMRLRRNLEGGQIIHSRDGLVNRLYLSVHTTKQADTA